MERDRRPGGHLAASECPQQHELHHRPGGLVAAGNRLLGTTLAGGGVAVAATGQLALMTNGPSGLGRLI